MSGNYTNDCQMGTKKNNWIGKIPSKRLYFAIKSPTRKVENGAGKQLCRGDSNEERKGDDGMDPVNNKAERTIFSRISLPCQTIPSQVGIHNTLKRQELECR
jgi:hypothetical protein